MPTISIRAKGVKVAPFVLISACLLVGKSHAQTLDLPPRPLDSKGGSAFARSIADLPLAGREQAILAEILRGNVPASSRKLVPVTLTDGPLTLTFHVTPDYLAIGSDDDHWLTPVSPATAQRLADQLGCSLPTTKMVDAIYAAATVKLDPSPIPPSPAMTTVAVFLDHNQTIANQRQGRPPGSLIAGHKKDVVLSKKAFATPGKVAIYGWHREVGKPIQPLYAGHKDSWVDYSHGIRLISRTVLLDGKPRSIEEILADPKLAPLLSDEGVMAQTRYLTASPCPEGAEVLQLDRGVRVLIDRPTPCPPDKPVLLVFYALPNGGTIEHAIGKVTRPGDDWHYEIQQIAAQTRFVREVNNDRNLVVAYLENDLKSWPAWRKAQGDGPISAILDTVRAKFVAETTRVALTGHSGGGSLIFGYLNTVEAIPESIERIAFLDANYAYETDRHRDKLATWLNQSDRHFLSVLAYNDAVALLNGKTFVSEAGGTWGKSHQMRRDLGSLLTFTDQVTPSTQRFSALGGRVEFRLTENPEKKILHTVQVERNGFIHVLLSGTNLAENGYTYMGDRAYSRFIPRD